MRFQSEAIMLLAPRSLRNCPGSPAAYDSYLLDRAASLAGIFDVTQENRIAIFHTAGLNCMKSCPFGAEDSRHAKGFSQSVFTYITPHNMLSKVSALGMFLLNFYMAIGGTVRLQSFLHYLHSN